MIDDDHMKHAIAIVRMRQEMYGPDVEEDAKLAVWAYFKSKRSFEMAQLKQLRREGFEPRIKSVGECDA